MFFTPGTHKDHGLTHNPFKAIVAPRPIGWISTISRDGRFNLSPYSFFNAISESPMMVGFCASPKASDGVSDTSDKDSLINARDTGCFTVNIVSAAQMQAMGATSAPLPFGASEFDYAELHPTPSEIIAAPRVEGAPCHLECTVWDILPLPPNAHGKRNHWVMGEVVGVHIDDACVKDGKLDVLQYQPVSRLGYKDYAVVDRIVNI